MEQLLGVEKDAERNRRIIQRHGGAILQPDRIDVARLVAGQVALARMGDRVRLAQRTGQVLADRLRAGVEARLHPVAQLQADIAVEAQRLAIAMRAIAVGSIGGDGGIGVAMVIGIAIGHLAPQRVEAAAVDAQLGSRRASPGRRHRVDRAAQCRTAQPQRVAAAIDLQMLEDLRVQLLKIAIVVGRVDRDAILQQRQPAHMIAARQARSPNRQAHFLPEARLGVDAGRKAERIAQRHGKLVFIGLGGNDIDSARRALDPRRSRLDDRVGGNDDRALLGIVFGRSGADGQDKDEGAQRQAARGLDGTHGVATFGMPPARLFNAASV